jgi:hypothetical protein
VATRSQWLTVSMVALSMASIAREARAATIYVRVDATGANNGTTWANAFVHLADAISIAASGDTIFVSEGVYRPDESSSFLNPNPPVRGNRASRFQLRDGVAIYGGFIGFESSPETRKGSALYTVLSADLAGDDALGSKSENAYRLLVAYEQVGESAVIDGFRVVGGNANMPNLADDGGGIVVQSASPIVRNCIFDGNYAIDRGGAAFVLAGFPSGFGPSAPLFVGCEFLANEAATGGGGIAVQAVGSVASEAVVVNCQFAHNESPGEGGAVYVAGSSSVADLRGCLLHDNVTGGPGGIASVGTGCALMLRDSTAAYNVAVSASGGVVSSGSVTTTNAIVWANAVTGMAGAPQFVGSATVNYSCVQGAIPPGGTGNLSSDPLFADPVQRDLRIVPWSPCVDSGSNLLVSDDAGDLDGDGNQVEPVPFTIDGSTRFVDVTSFPDTGVGSAPIVDRGAYESTGVVCQQDIGYQGPGTLHLSICSPMDIKLPGTSATLEITGASANAQLILLGSAFATPTLAFGGTLVPLFNPLVGLLTANMEGEFTATVPGGLGPLVYYLQAVQNDGPPVEISNAVRLVE